MSKRQLRKESFLKLTLRFGGIFMLVVVIIQVLLELFRSGNLKAVSKSIDDGTWVQNIINLLIIGIVYGVTTTLIKKNTAKKL